MDLGYRQNWEIAWNWAFITGIWVEMKELFTSNRWRLENSAIRLFWKFYKTGKCLLMPLCAPYRSILPKSLQIRIGTFQGLTHAMGPWLPSHYVCNILPPSMLRAAYECYKYVINSPLKANISPNYYSQMVNLPPELLNLIQSFIHVLLSF